MMLKGKVVLVTGGASGIGLACAEEFLRNDCLGAAIVDINADRGVAVESGLNKKYGNGKVIFVKTDVTKKDQVDDAFKRTIDVFKQLDIVFINAGISNERDYELVLNVNLKGAICCLKFAIDVYLPRYKSTEEGLIISTSSVAGLDPLEGIEIYSTTKAGIISLTRSFGIEYHYKRTGVKVIAICPGATQTELVENVEDTLFYKDPKPLFCSIVHKFNQTVEELSKALVRVVNVADNGSVWTIIMGKESKVEFHKHVNM